MLKYINKIIIIAVIPALFAIGCEKKEAAVDNVVLDKIKAGATIVDVRSPEEVAEGVYQGAVNIPIDEAEKRVAEFGPKDKAVVLYCRSGGRAGRVKQFLESQGYTDVTNAGGLRDMPSVN